MDYGKSRNSKRLKHAQRVQIIDQSSRKRRMRRFHETLLADNHHEDPTGDLVMSKKVPKFEESFQKETSKKKKKKERSLEYFKIKYRRSIPQLVEEDARDTPKIEQKTYYNISAPRSKFPPYNLCAVCGYQSNYNCVSCGVKVCNAKCLEMHAETRCLKWAS